MWDRTVLRARRSAAMKRYASTQASFGGTDEFRKGNIQFGNDREQRHDGGVVGSTLEPANDIAVKSGAMRQRLLTQRQGLATLTNFFAQRFEKVFCCHSRHI